MSESKKNTTENTTEAKKSGNKKVKIKLPLTRELRGDVFVSVNNYTCVIKRGVEVEVPLFVKEVLDRREEMQAKRMALEENRKK